MRTDNNVSPLVKPHLKRLNHTHIKLAIWTKIRGTGRNIKIRIEKTRGAFITHGNLWKSKEIYPMTKLIAFEDLT